MKFNEWSQTTGVTWRAYGSVGMMMLSVGSFDSGVLDLSDYESIRAMPSYLWLQRKEPENDSQVQWALERLCRAIQEDKAIRWGTQCRLMDHVNCIKNELETVQHD